MSPWWLLALAVVPLAIVARRHRAARLHRHEYAPVRAPILFLTPAMAVRPTVLGHTVPLGHRLASLWFGSALVDRSGTLDSGIPVALLDEIPKEDGATHDASERALHALCRERARAILERARSERRAVRVLWSGGIDSTAAACALLELAEPGTDRLSFYHGRHSRHEHPAFFRTVLKSCRRVGIGHVREALGSEDLIVTGEHGDQLFGSLKALSIEPHALESPWAEAFPRELNRTLASGYRTDSVLRYLAPQIEASPVANGTFGQLLWWLNFSLKWQSVTLRIPAQVESARRAPGRVLEQLSLTEHFFRGEGFQRWALARGGRASHERERNRYKRVLKTFIHGFDGDDAYLETKLKQPSLSAVSSSEHARRCLAVTLDGHVFTQPLDTSLKRAIPASERDHRTAREAGLWVAIESSGE